MRTGFVVILCQFLHARFPMFESRVSCAIEISGVGCDLTGIRPISYEEKLCEQKTNCVACGRLLTNKKHECNKPYCANCKHNMQFGHICYMATSKNELPRSDNVLFVSYDFETTQDTKVSDSATLHVPNLVCLQQLCTKCDMLTDINEDCVRCGRRKHSFWNDPIGDLFSYLCEPRPWVNKVMAIAHNAKAFDSQFILNRAIKMKWKIELILNMCA